MVDDHPEETVFDRIIWDPEFHHAGVDQTDEFATEDVMARTRLGKLLTEALDLNSVDEGKRWVRGTGEGAPALRSQVWGQFQPDENGSRNRYRNKGGVLWADRKRLATATEALGQSVAQTVHFSRYKTSRYENDVKTVRAVYLVLHNPDGSWRIGEAEKAAKTEY